MADRELKVVIIGDSSSLQSSLQRAESYTTSFGSSLTKQESAYARTQLASIEASKGVGQFETSLKNAVVASGNAGGMADGLARKMGALGQLGFTPATLGLVGVVAGLGLAVEAGKTMIDNADNNEAAQLSLEQAYTSQKLALSDYQGTIDKFLDSNKRFIADEYEAKNAFATATRAGFDQTMVMRIMNDAVDLSAAKHVSLTDAMKTLIMAEEGNTRGLRDLGFSATDLNAIMKAAPESLKDVDSAQKTVTASSDRLAAAQDALAHFEIVLHEKKKIKASDLDTEREKQEAVTKASADLKKAQDDLATATSGVVVNSQSQAALLDVVEPKIAKARDTTTAHAQAQHGLNHSAEEFSNKYGPAMATALSNVLDMLDLSIQGTGILAGKIGDVLNAAGAAPASFNANRGRFGGAQAPAPASFVPSSRGTFAGNVDDMGPGANVNITQHFSVPDPAAAAALMRQEVHRIFS